MKKAVVDYNSINTNNTSQISNYGYMFLGKRNDTSNKNNNGQEPINEIPDSSSYMSSSQNGGNVQQNFFYTNTNGPIIYESTLDDQKQIIDKYAKLSALNAAVTFYPYLYPLASLRQYTSTTQQVVAESSSKNTTSVVYKCLGKGVGEIVYAKNSSGYSGDEKSSNTKITTYPKTNHDTLIYPYDGYLYSGQIVQLFIQENLETGLKETCVVPYQSGRGIPNYLDFYNVPTSLGNVKLNNFSPFGQIQWPDSKNAMTPCLAPGVDPGYSNTCFGVVLDSSSNRAQTTQQFKFSLPNGFTQDQLNTDPHSSYKNHPAPHTVSAVSVVNTEISTPKTQGYLSPGPNSSDTFYAPWPRYYAYQPGDPVPILRRGITTLTIGAAYNIALMAYPLRVQISQTETTYITVPCIPLFQGEILEAGSYIYAAVKGHEMTGGPVQNTTVSDAFFGMGTTPVGQLGQTPWDHFADKTYGNFGWTGTPALSFNNIPDAGKAIIETVFDENGNTQSLPFLNQSNQGTVIVHPVSIFNTSPGLGNSFLTTQKEKDFYFAQTEEEVLQIQRDRFKLPGLSGRNVLSQTNPEKAQPIGVLLERIEGSGKWPYTGLVLSDITNDRTLTSLEIGGISYVDPSTITEMDLRGGTGANIKGIWTNNLPLPPNLGSLLPPLTITDPGNSGYTNGDILTFQDRNFTYGIPFYPLTQYKSNNCAVEFRTGPDRLILYDNGSGYSNATNVPCFNLSLNNAYYLFDRLNPAPQGPNGVIDRIFQGILDPDLYYQDFSRLRVGTRIRVLQIGPPAPTVNEENSGYFEIDEIPTVLNSNLTPIRSGTGYDFSFATSYTYETETVNVYENKAPNVNVTINAGEIDLIEINDYGIGNRPGDRILILDGDQNAVFEMPERVTGAQEITSTGPFYSENNPSTYDTVRADNGVDDSLQIRVYVSGILTLPDESLLPQFYQVVNSGSGVPGIVYNLQYTGNFNVHPSPWYHCNCCAVNYPANNTSERIWGGSYYTTATNVSCYNLSANSIRINYSVQNEILLNIVTTPNLYSDNLYRVLQDRYTFSSSNGTQVRILNNDTPEEIQEIIRLDSFNDNNELSASIIRKGGKYTNTTNGNRVFQTQRLDQINPTVDIQEVGGTNNNVRRLILRNPGENNQKNDLILVTQEGSGMNCIFVYENNRGYIDLPPYADSPNPQYSVDRSEAAWQKYANAMSSAQNLYDRQVLVEMRPHPDQTIENITPYAIRSGNYAPTTADIYRQDYNEWRDTELRLN